MIPFSIGKADGGFDQLDQGQSSESIDMASTIDKAFLYTSFSLFLGTILFGLLWFKAAITDVLARRMKRLLTVSLIMMGGALCSSCRFKLNQRQTCPFRGISTISLQETIASTSGGSLWMMLMASFVLLTIWTIVAMKRKLHFLPGMAVSTAHFHRTPLAESTNRSSSRNR